MADPEHGGGERPYRGFDYRALLPGGRLEVVTDEEGGTGGGSSRSSIAGYYFEDEPPTEHSTFCGCLPHLSWRERCLGCGTCFLAGYLLGLGSWWRLKELLLDHNPIPFTVNATAGNVIALAGSCFLSGPQTQAQKMWHPVRRTATAAYLGSLVVTLLVAWWGRKLPLQGMILMFLMGFQNAAIVWYTLSYVPYGQEAVKSFVRRWWNRNNAEY